MLITGNILEEKWIHVDPCSLAHGCSRMQWNMTFLTIPAFSDNYNDFEFQTTIILYLYCVSLS